MLHDFCVFFFVSKYITSFTQKKKVDGFHREPHEILKQKHRSKTKKNGWMCPPFLGVSVSAKVQPP